MKIRNGEVAVGCRRWWKTRQFFVVTAAMVAALAIGTSQPAVAQPAPCTSNCASLTVGDAEIASGGSGPVTVSFQQAQPGGADELAAIAFTLQISDQLSLDGCDLNADGLPSAVTPNAVALANFKVVVENASCTAGRTHCLCDTATPDSFINIVVYGPNPLPAPGSPVEIPVIPSGDLMTIRLAVDAGVAGGTVIPLHVLRENDGAKPQFQAYLSVGDKDAVDQTCVPQVGTPPCTGGGAVSQINSTDGQVSVIAGCTADCDGLGTVTVDEIVKMVNIALGSLPMSECPPGDRDGSGTVTVDEIVQAVNNALGGCPQ